jgi:ABC-type transporter Mla subunit MlaD
MSIQLNHESVNQAIEEMQQATATMDQNLQDLLQGLQSMAATFSGQSATAWEQFRTVAQSADAQMQADFGQGANRLQMMHEAHIDADTNGTRIFGQ